MLNVKDFLYLFSDVHQMYAWHRAETLPSGFIPGIPVSAYSSGCHRCLRKVRLKFPIQTMRKGCK